MHGVKSTHGSPAPARRKAAAHHPSGASKDSSSTNDADDLPLVHKQKTKTKNDASGLEPLVSQMRGRGGGEGEKIGIYPIRTTQKLGNAKPSRGIYEALLDGAGEPCS